MAQQLFMDTHLLKFKTADIIGKRMCSLDSLAKHTYYLFVAALVKKFKFQAAPNEPLPTPDPLNGLTLGYMGFKAVVTPRYWQSYRPHAFFRTTVRFRCFTSTKRGCLFKVEVRCKFELRRCVPPSFQLNKHLIFDAKFFL